MCIRDRFLFRFLPITLALYYLAPARLKNTVLFLCSLVFYSWGEVRLFPVMAAAILINYTAGLGIERFKDSAAARRGLDVYKRQVVRTMDATLAAFSNAERVTLVGSTIPALIMSPYTSFWASKP